MTLFTRSSFHRLAGGLGPLLVAAGSFIVLQPAQAAADTTTHTTREQRMQEAYDNYRARVDRAAGSGPAARAEAKTWHGAERAGQAVKHGAHKTGDAIEHGARKTGEAVGRGMEKSGEAVDRTGEKLRRESRD